MDIEHLGDLKPDRANARQHNPRNVGMIVDALQLVGAARSIVIDEDGVVLAGNATIDAAAEAGIERVQVVDADGETIVAVRRTGLTSEQKKQLAYFDNRSAELSDWNLEQIVADLADGVDVGVMFRDDELAELLEGLELPIPETQTESVLEYPHLVELYCTAEVLRMIAPVLEEWRGIDGVKIDIS